MISAAGFDESLNTAFRLDNRPADSFCFYTHLNTGVYYEKQ